MSSGNPIIFGFILLAMFVLLVLGTWQQLRDRAKLEGWARAKGFRIIDPEPEGVAEGSLFGVRRERRPLHPVIVRDEAARARIRRQLISSQ